jgi:DHA1 family bicyclomycin/chloramphenicol resistance-like MFS transporter
MTAAPRQPPFALLAALTALGPLAQNIFIPSLPALPDVFDAGYGAVQLTLSLFFLGFAVAQLAYGPLADRFGRRPTMLAGLALFCLGTLMCLAANALWVLIVGRFVQAVGGCAGMVLTRAVIRDVHDRETAASVIAYVVMAMVVAPMFAPLIGGVLEEWVGWRGGFAVTGAVGLVVLVAAAATLNETIPARRPLPGLGGTARTYARLLGQPALRAYVGNAAFLTAGFFAFLGGAPYVIVDAMGRPPSEYGLYFVIPAVAYMGANFLAGRISARVGVDRMVALGSAASLAGAALMLAVALAGGFHPLAVFLPMILFSAGNGLGLPNAMAGAVSVDPSYAGTASGLLGFVQMAVGALWSAMAGAAATDSQLPLAALMTAAAALAVLFAALLARLAGKAPAERTRPAG